MPTSSSGRPQRAAVIHVNHWHSTYDASYLRLLQEAGIEIVGVSDANKAIVENRAQKFKTRAYTRCNKCGRPRAVFKKFGLCRICLRELAHNGSIPGMTKSSW